MPSPLAYFITWTCYGQRLHGDARGSVDDAHNLRGTPKLAPNPSLEADQHRLMTSPTFLLTQPMVPIADDAIAELCSERGWRLLAQSTRSTHVHVVVSCRDSTSPERCMAQMKARATRELRRRPLVSADARLWTHHGSTRWINHEHGLFAAIGYVNDWQDGVNRELLEQRRRRADEQIESLKAWLRSRDLPEDGRTVVWGETEEERTHRLHPGIR